MNDQIGPCEWDVSCEDELEIERPPSIDTDLVGGRTKRLRVWVKLLEIEAELAWDVDAEEEFELVQRCKDLMESELRTYEAMRKESE